MVLKSKAVMAAARLDDRSGDRPCQIDEAETHDRQQQNRAVLEPLASPLRFGKRWLVRSGPNRCPAASADRARRRSGRIQPHDHEHDDDLDQRRTRGSPIERSSRSAE